MSSLRGDINEAFITQFRFTAGRISRSMIKPRKFRQSTGQLFIQARTYVTWERGIFVIALGNEPAGYFGETKSIGKRVFSL